MRVCNRKRGSECEGLCIVTEESQELQRIPATAFQAAGSSGVILYLIFFPNQIQLKPLVHTCDEPIQHIHDFHFRVKRSRH